MSKSTLVISNFFRKISEIFEILTLNALKEIDTQILYLIYLTEINSSGCLFEIVPGCLFGIALGCLFGIVFGCLFANA